MRRPSLPESRAPCPLGLCLALLCCVGAAPSLASSLGGHHFPDPLQAEFVRSLDSYSVSVPSRVDHEGNFLSHDLHAHRRLARSVGDAASGSDGTLHYRIPVEGREVRVRLLENRDLLAKAAVVERVRRKYGNVSDSVFSRPTSRGCHFRGEVTGEERSLVALAACHGLTGFLHTSQGQFFIEPVRGHSRGDGQLPHLVYRRSALPHHLDILRSIPVPDSSSGGCGVKDAEDRAFGVRERWEKHRKRPYSTHAQRRRRKRSISTEKHVEAMVMVDPEMVAYYQNEDIENYVLTVMNMVATLFHDATIGNAINIHLVRLILLEDHQEDLKITHHADNTLRSFCEWQKKVNMGDDSHPNHHDTAIMLTRHNICSRMNEPCSTLGLAQVAGMCQPHRSCSINEDTGLALAYTVAHEVGHNFGMKHDSIHNECASPEGEQYVMAPHLVADSKPMTWSQCSRLAITKFLDRDWGYCLDDEPGLHDFTFPVLPPGTMYDADHQCRLQYGPSAALCDGIEVKEQICGVLWCRVNNKCSTKLQAAAEGTICGNNKWCFAGECVEIGERPMAINGEWGEWSEWTKCTRTCDAGISHSQRHCDNPPPSNGGKYCLGERKRYRVCNTQPCPDDTPSFREVQCSEFNKVAYKDALYEWLPVPTPDTPCQLHCKPKNKFFSVLLKDTVTDGTPCVPGSRDMCISGRCRHVGCDWLIDSNAVEDHCGVCYGDGSTCTTIKQQFNKTEKLGYVEATVIPKHARNIRVEEVAEANNFLALRNPGGEYYLNGHWFIQWSGDYAAAGTVVHYQREGNKESFAAPGPLKEPLVIMLLIQSHNPGVVFEYTVPKENVTDTRQPEFRWDYSDWSHCTVSCGGGTQRSQVQCLEKEAGLVDDKYCNASTKPDDKLRSCNDHLCPARWWTGPWQHCSVTCGKNGVHRRTVICVRSLGPDEQIALEDAACEDLERPTEVEACHRKEPCPGSSYWVAGDWFPCTRSCGGGVQYRKVWCPGINNCDLAEEPASQRQCGDAPCPANVTAPLSPSLSSPTQPSSSTASTTTAPTSTGTSSITTVVAKTTLPSSRTTRKASEEGEGKKDDAVSFGTGTISVGEGGQVPGPVLEPKEEGAPDGKPHPKGPRKSDTDVVITAGKTEEGGDGGGDDGGKGKVVADNGAILNPIEGRLHSPDLYTSIREGGDHAEDDVVKEEELNHDNVNHMWQAGDWNTCSRPCGRGVRTRTVACVDTSTRTEIGDDLCDITRKPTAIEDCHVTACAAWQTTPWSECSATCGYAVQRRHVICPRSGQCDDSEEPPALRQCDLAPCIAWVNGDWSQCSKTCGGGTQMRLVQCVNLTSQLSVGGCDVSVKPPDNQSCNSEDCPSENAALTITCESNEMSYRVCNMLKRLGHCSNDYVQAKCCRSCGDHKREGLKKSMSSRR